MGMTAATALVGADRAVNAFLAVDGDGVSIDDDGSIVCDRSAAGSVTVSARPGWLVNGRESVSVDPKRGSGLKVTSKLGEDEEHVHVFPRTVEDVHVEDIVLVAEATPASQIAMYALPDTSTVVSASATHKVEKRGKHRETTTYYPCVCGEVHDPQEVVRTYEVEPDHYEWTASGAGQTVESSTWMGQMSKGLRQRISFQVTGKRDECAACTCTATTNVLVDVHELSVTNDLYLGLDRTDFGRTNPVVKVAGALIAPEPTGSSAYSWIECGICSFTGRTDQAEVRYFAPDPDRGSASYLAETLTVRGTATSAEGLSASANCTTNFTVVKVDVTIGGVGEDKEETEGAFIPYVADATNGVISVEGTNKLVLVRLTCEPDNLPTNETVRVSCTGPAELYQKLSDGEFVRVVSTNYFANEISGLDFVLHGHNVSGACKDGLIKIEHLTSGAKDVAKYTSVKVNVEITDFPTKTLLGEDKEEMPGAFIPYAADWAFTETPSEEADIPFGPSAQEKLVEVFVSYEPADLPEDEDRSVKFLEFEAPPNSLYLPAESAGVDQRWIEFLNWWNTRPPSWAMTFAGKKRLLLHGHEKSDPQRDRVIRVTHTKSGATDMAKYTVFHVDLDIDSDNDLSIEREDGFEDAIEEREPGKIISWDQSGISPGQDYRVPLQLRAWGGETNAVVRIDADSSSPRVADIYSTEAGGTKLDLPLYFPADSIPPLYVDGVTNGTINFTATLINPPEDVPSTTTVRPIPGLELADDKVAALVIQPISFAPGRGRHAGAWISDPCMDQPGNTNRAMRTANRFAKVAKSVGFTFEEHEEWCVDWTDGYDDDPGDLTLERFKKMANCGLVLFKGHGGVGRNIPVLFANTSQGISAANLWCAGEAGMKADRCQLTNGTFRCVRCYSPWYAANWKPQLNNGNAIVYWQSCHSAEGASSIEQSAGGRWRIAWGPSSGFDGAVNDRESETVVRGTLEVMSKNPNARSAALALEAGSAFMYGTCKTSGNPWTTLCPGPIPGAGYFPREVVKKNTPALGGMILDTFIDDEWSPECLIKTSGETTDGDISPCWLRQEGCNRPFGVVFRIHKLSDQAVEVTALHRMVRNSGAYYDDLPFVKIGMDEVDYPAWDSNAPGRALDADGVAPNNNDMKWRY